MAHSFLAALALISLLTLVPNQHQAWADVPFADDETVLLLGDSITQDGRYVDLIRGYLWAVYPERRIRIINAGLSSETVSGITEPVHPYPRPNILDRIDRALELADPDWVCVCYGMNDGIYHPAEPRITEAYHQGLDRVLAKIEATGAKTILLSPPVFDEQAPAVVERIAASDEGEPYGYRNPYPEYDSTLVALTNIARSFEDDPRVDRFIDVHAATAEFLESAKAADPEFVYGDGVHPPVEGHRAMAAAILAGLGEDSTQVDRVLARFTGLRPPGATDETLTADGAAEEIRSALFERGRDLSAAYRRAIDPATPAAEAPSIIAEAQAIADQRAVEIQGLVAPEPIDASNQ